GNSYRGAFNLGDAYYKQGKYKEAAEQFEMLTQRKTNNDTLSKAYHNLGNSYLKQKEFEKSITAYKNALKKNMDDEETRYNLAYAQKMLKQQQEQQKQNQDKKDHDKNKDKNKDKNQDKSKDKKKDDKQEQQQQNISKEDAQRLLEALNNDEKKLRDKMNEKKVKVAKTQIEKDW
ncbi:MAG: tetratricopeptide repeat protein, partial [Bacteroidota bacterium]